MSTRTRIVIIGGIVCAALVLFVCKMSRTNLSSESARTNSPPIFSVGETPKATPEIARATSPDSTPPTSASPNLSPVLRDTKLLIPVVGVRAEQLRDTFDDARSEGRVHNAVDIMAAHNTPVVAAADGRIVKLFQSARGGTTLYQIGTDERTVFYYGHLDHYADGIAENYFTHRGETIAYVGDTGNAGAGNYHLHFAIWIISDPKHFWNGAEINPYPLLKK